MARFLLWPALLLCAALGAAAAESPGAAISNKLATIRIPEVDFRGANIHDIADFLSDYGGQSIQDLNLSDALNESSRLRVTPKAIRTIEFKGGLDAYLLGTPNRKLTPKAKRLKRRIERKRAAGNA